MKSASGMLYLLKQGLLNCLCYDLSIDGFVCFLCFVKLAFWVSFMFVIFCVNMSFDLNLCFFCHKV